MFRLWAKDPSIFGQNHQLMLDWLNEPEDMLSRIDELWKIVAHVEEHDFSAIVLLGMGGSSLAVKVIEEILASQSSKKFLVLDTIHPSAIRRIEQSIDLATTLFIVASKSGSTLEPNLLYRYFLAQLKKAGVEATPSHFIAITDPGTTLALEAQNSDFLANIAGKALIGGRYSALSPFGIMPALLMGVDAKKLLESTMSMVRDCGHTVMIEHNPGALLGLFLGVNVSLGRDQLVFHFSPKIKALGLWLEQLIAESLGKDQGGIVPIVDGGIAIVQPKSFHCVIELAGDQVALSTKEALKNAQVPCIYLTIPDLYALGAEMFRWQIAVSVAATVLKLNPFDQPDVEKSKKSAAFILEQMSENKYINPATPCFSSNALDIFAKGSDRETINILASFFSMIKNGDYCAVLSYLDETDENLLYLQSLVSQVRQRAVPTLLQSGPRYLHSTGQLFKGGKNNGHFILITGTYEDSLASDMGLNFKDIHLSQAFGDYQAMLDQGRHILHIHLKDIAVGFRELLALSKHM